MEKVLVSGGTGVTGTALVRYLLDEGKAVVAIIRPNSSRKRYLPKDDNLTIVECELKDYDTLDKDILGDNFSVFYHLAWDGSTGKEKTDNRNNMDLQSKNIIYDIKAVELCNRIDCPVFLATGTQAEYGLCSEVINEDTITNPQNGYGSAKLCAGQMTRILCEKYGIKHIWVRLFSIYGPYDGTQSLIYTTILKLLSDVRPQYTQGIQIWDYLYSFDAARAMVLLAESGEAGETYCVANGNARPLKEYIKDIHRIVKPDLKPVFGEIPYGNNAVMNMQVDISKLKAATGFEAQTSFEEGIGQILEWSKLELEELNNVEEFI